jgi:anti-sigma factor RsiW
MGFSPPDRDEDLLSEYLDGALDDGARAALEARLEAEPELRRQLAALRQTVALIRALPPRKAPRDFTLTPAQAAAARARNGSPASRDMPVAEAEPILPPNVLPLPTVERRVQRRRPPVWMAAVAGGVAALLCVGALVLNNAANLTFSSTVNNFEPASAPQVGAAPTRQREATGTTDVDADALMFTPSTGRMLIETVTPEGTMALFTSTDQPPTLMMPEMTVLAAQPPMTVTGVGATVNQQALSLTQTQPAMASPRPTQPFTATVPASLPASTEAALYSLEMVAEPSVTAVGTLLNEAMAEREGDQTEELIGGAMDAQPAEADADTAFSTTLAETTPPPASSPEDDAVAEAAGAGATPGAPLMLAPETLLAVLLALLRALRGMS